MRVHLSREVDEDEELDGAALAALGKVVAPRYPKERKEGWWLVVGDSKNNNLYSIKRVALVKESKVTVN